MSAFMLLFISATSVTPLVIYEKCLK